MPLLFVAILIRAFGQAVAGLLALLSVTPGAESAAGT